MIFEVHLISHDIWNTVCIHTASLEKYERWGGVKETFWVEGTAPEVTNQEIKGNIKGTDA